MSDTMDIRRIRTQKLATEQGPVTPKRSTWQELLNRDISFSGNKFPDKIKESFYIELYSLMEAGVDIRTALDLAGAEQRKKSVKNIIAEVQGQIVAGSSFSTALMRTKGFSNYEFYSVQIGEETGRLPFVLKDLSAYFAKRVKQRRQIVSALTYPVMVLTVAIAAISFMMAFVVPMFADTFKRFGSELPGITKAVIAASALVGRLIVPFLVLMTAAVCFCVWQSRKQWFRKLSASVLLRLPVIGTMLHKIYLSRFANTMALLAGAKIPMLQSVQMLRQMISFYPMEMSLSEIEKKIINGEPLHTCLSYYTIYPAKMVAVIKVGEEVNQLELFFSRLSDQYSADVEHQSSMLSKFIEPVIIILLGLIVGLILIAMYLPMFRLGQTF